MVDTYQSQQSCGKVDSVDYDTVDMVQDIVTFLCIHIVHWLVDIPARGSTFKLAATSNLVRKNPAVGSE